MSKPAFSVAASHVKWYTVLKALIYDYGTHESIQAEFLDLVQTSVATHDHCDAVLSVLLYGSVLGSDPRPRVFIFMCSYMRLQVLRLTGCISFPPPSLTYPPPSLPIPSFHVIDHGAHVSCEV